MSSFLGDIDKSISETDAKSAGARLASFLDKSRICGDLISIDYASAVVLVHDKLRADVGGVSKGCFLLASRVVPGSSPDPENEDTSLVLLRVLDKAPLPNSSETERMRFDAGQRVSDSPAGENWDDEAVLDRYTANFLRFSGVKCRVIGTFMMKSHVPGEWKISFGADLANIYSGKGMKVYKPDSEALNLIANYYRHQGSDAHPLAGMRIRIGRVRYAASERQGDTTEKVGVMLDPTDLIARRTALFGMSRTGKSNTVKIIASSVFNLRGIDYKVGRIGQLILDANGEYANENAIDIRAMRNVWQGCNGASENDVVTYGLYPHPRDPGRRLVKLNFFGANPQDWRQRNQVVAAVHPLVQAKQIVDGVLSQVNDKYIVGFKNVTLDVPDDWDDSACTRYKRKIMAYRSILVHAGLSAPGDMLRADLNGLTNIDLRKALMVPPSSAKETNYAPAARIFEKGDVSWSEALEAFRLLGQAINAKDSRYKTFNDAYRAKPKNVDGRDWHDSDLLNILSFLEHRGGVRLLSQVNAQHSVMAGEDYADLIVKDLSAGKMVIVDQSTGDPEMNRNAADRLMWRIFEHQKSAFISPQVDADGGMILPPDVIVYIEEAHNLLPKQGDDLKGIWARVSKEGSKYRIGLVYATQEPSSILTNILSNTDNWFVAHLNRGAEVKQVMDFYDFADFEQQILNVPEPGFIRMRTLSNPYVVPVQIDPFIVMGQANSMNKS